ncbi:hypothetical protein [Cerasicoccus fimbriatus]|nr:hypothetical protein [Cerasicoccus sp. TK19100]
MSVLPLKVSAYVSAGQEGTRLRELLALMTNLLCRSHQLTDMRSVWGFY